MKKLFFVTTLLVSTLIHAKTSKDIWMEYNGINYCRPSYCADKIPVRPLQLALKYYRNHNDEFKNNEFIGIIDMDYKSTEKRFYILNLKTGEVSNMLVTHGKKSETDNATAGKFSNEVGSEMSSLGFYRTGNSTYVGKHGESLKLYGLSKSNSNALERGIVIHSADYATQSFVDERGRLGLSQGCPAVSPNKIGEVISKLSGSSLLFIYSSQLETTAGI